MENNSITLQAHAKINLGLEVIKKRTDRYHELRMVMQSLLLHDIISIKKIKEKDIIIHTNLPWLPTDERNLVYKAAALMREKFSLPGGIYIEITKHIPVSAGLGGGSADCAAALLGLNKLYELKIPRPLLYNLGASLGADVPFCILRNTALVTGKGEKLTPLTAHPFVYVLLAKPPFSISTAEAFDDLINYKLPPEDDKIDNLVQAIENKSILSICKYFFNHLEVTAQKYPIIEEIKRVMLNNGAFGALMSGSGPTVFGYFKTKDSAEEATEHIKNLGIKDIILTGIYTGGVQNNFNTKANFLKDKYIWD